MFSIFEAFVDQTISTLALERFRGRLSLAVSCQGHAKIVVQLCVVKQINIRKWFTNRMILQSSLIGK
jgi:hypothetical protein